LISREAKQLREVEKLARFEQAILPHFDAAYNLARWLTREGHDAEDVVQEAYLRAYKFFDRFHGGDGRSWLLAIVRNTCYTWLKHNRPAEPAMPLDEDKYGEADPAARPEGVLVRRENIQMLRQALDKLPPEFREMIVLRELEGLSYKDIAGIAGVPLGTVMSRLARGRKRLEQELAGPGSEEP
jgi:RNA polymerase sigma-70 factor (ECF subfamily)